MSESHLDRNLLLRLLMGDLHGSVLPMALRHLLELCPQCKAAFDRFTAECLERGEFPARGEEREERLAAARRYQAPLERGRAVAARRLERLLARPVEARRHEVEADPELRGPALAHLLLDQARSRLPARPRESYALADLARAVLDHGEADTLEVELYARAQAYLGNALRVQGELPAADVRFAGARYLLRTHGGGDRRLLAELDDLEASLRRDQRRFPQARELLERALAVYDLEHRSLESARVLINLGVVHREAGDFQDALAATEAALAFLDPEEEPHLARVAAHNLAQFQTDLGDYPAARAWLAEAEPLYRRFPEPAIHLRHLWLEANVARGEGDEAAAEAGYLAVRDGFRREDSSYDLALVSLDLAALYLAQGRAAEVQALAEEMVPLFEAREVHREAAAAVMLFADAARARRLSRRSVDELARYLEAARRDPAFPFQPPA